MFAGILDLVPNSAITYRATTSSDPKMSRPNSVRRRGLGPKA